MKKIITFILLSSFVVGTFGYTTTDVSQANYLASKRIIKDWSSEPKNYRFDDYIARSEIMGMVLAMVGITRNSTCRGDFVDVPKSDTDWVCRTIETAADKGFINAKPVGMKTRPYGNITRAEAFSILLKAANFGPIKEYGTFVSKDSDATTWQKELFVKIRNLGIEVPGTQYLPSNNPSIPYKFFPNRIGTRGEIFHFAYMILAAQKPLGTCGEWNNYDFASLSNMDGLDLMALSGTNDRFCASGSMSHLYENNTGMSWSCNGSDYRICKTNGFSYGNSRLYVGSVMGEGKKGTLVTLDVLNFPFNNILQIQAGNYSRHGMIQLVEGYGVSSDGKKVTFTLPSNLNGAMGQYPGESHLPDEPYAIYLTNTSNGEYVKLYNPFGSAITQK